MDTRDNAGAKAHASQHDTSHGSSGSKANVIVALAVGLVLGFFGGKATTMGPGKGGDNGTPQAAAAAAPSAPSAAAKPTRQADTNVFKVPLEDSPRQGSDEALVTMVEFTDYQ